MRLNFAAIVFIEVKGYELPYVNACYWHVYWVSGNYSVTIVLTLENLFCQLRQCLILPKIFVFLISTQFYLHDLYSNWFSSRYGQ